MKGELNVNMENSALQPQPMKFAEVRKHLAAFSYVVEAELDREWERRYRQISDPLIADASSPSESSP